MVSLKEKFTKENYKWLLKWLSIGAGAALLINGVLRYVFFLSMLSEPWTLFQPFYVILFGIIICGGEFENKYILEKIHFMNSYLGRGVFDFFVATICTSYVGSGTINIFGIVISIVLAVIGISYIIFHFQGDKISEIDTLVAASTTAAATTTQSSSSTVQTQQKENISSGKSSINTNASQENSVNLEKSLYGSKYTVQQQQQQ